MATTTAAAAAAVEQTIMKNEIDVDRKEQKVTDSQKNELKDDKNNRENVIKYYIESLSGKDEKRLLNSITIPTRKDDDETSTQRMKNDNFTVGSAVSPLSMRSSLSYEQNPEKKSHTEETSKSELSPVPESPQMLTSQLVNDQLIEDQISSVTCTVTEVRSIERLLAATVNLTASENYEEKNVDNITKVKEAKEEKDEKEKEMTAEIIEITEENKVEDDTVKSEEKNEEPKEVVQEKLSVKISQGPTEENSILQDDAAVPLIHQESVKTNTVKSEIHENTKTENTKTDNINDKNNSNPDKSSDNKNIIKSHAHDYIQDLFQKITSSEKLLASKFIAVVSTDAVKNVRIKRLSKEYAVEVFESIKNDVVKKDVVRRNSITDINNISNDNHENNIIDNNRIVDNTDNTDNDNSNNIPDNNGTINDDGDNSNNNQNDNNDNNGSINDNSSKDDSNTNVYNTNVARTKRASKEYAVEVFENIQKDVVKDDVVRRNSTSDNVDKIVDNNDNIIIDNQNDPNNNTIDDNSHDVSNSDKDDDNVANTEGNDLTPVSVPQVTETENTGVENTETGNTENTKISSADENIIVVESDKKIDDEGKEEEGEKEKLKEGGEEEKEMKDEGKVEQEEIQKVDIPPVLSPPVEIVKEVEKDEGKKERKVEEREQKDEKEGKVQDELVAKKEVKEVVVQIIPILQHPAAIPIAKRALSLFEELHSSQEDSQENSQKNSKKSTRNDGNESPKGYENNSGNITPPTFNKNQKHASKSNLKGDLSLKATPPDSDGKTEKHHISFVENEEGEGEGEDENPYKDIYQEPSPEISRKPSIMEIENEKLKEYVNSVVTDKNDKNTPVGNNTNYQSFNDATTLMNINDSNSEEKAENRRRNSIDSVDNVILTNISDCFNDNDSDTNNILIDTTPMTTPINTNTASTNNTTTTTTNDTNTTNNTNTTTSNNTNDTNDNTTTNTDTQRTFSTEGRTQRTFSADGIVITTESIDDIDDDQFDPFAGQSPTSGYTQKRFDSFSVPRRTSKQPSEKIIVERSEKIHEYEDDSEGEGEDNQETVEKGEEEKVEEFFLPSNIYDDADNNVEKYNEILLNSKDEIIVTEKDFNRDLNNQNEVLNSDESEIERVLSRINSNQSSDEVIISDINNNIENSINNDILFYDGDHVVEPSREQGSEKAGEYGEQVGEYRESSEKIDHGNSNYNDMSSRASSSSQYEDELVSIPSYHPLNYDNNTNNNNYNNYNNNNSEIDGYKNINLSIETNNNHNFEANGKNQRKTSVPKSKKYTGLKRIKKSGSREKTENLPVLVDNNENKTELSELLVPDSNVGYNDDMYIQSNETNYPRFLSPVALVRILQSQSMPLNSVITRSPLLALNHRRKLPCSSFSSFSNEPQLSIIQKGIPKPLTKPKPLLSQSQPVSLHKNSISSNLSNITDVPDRKSPKSPKFGFNGIGNNFDLTEISVYEQLLPRSEIFKSFQSAIISLPRDENSVSMNEFELFENSINLVRPSLPRYGMHSVSSDNSEYIINKHDAKARRIMKNYNNENNNNNHNDNNNDNNSNNNMNKNDLRNRSSDTDTSSITGANSKNSFPTNLSPQYEYDKNKAYNEVYQELNKDLSDLNSGSMSSQETSVRSSTYVKSLSTTFQDLKKNDYTAHWQQKIILFLNSNIFSSATLLKKAIDNLRKQQLNVSSQMRGSVVGEHFNDMLDPMKRSGSLRNANMDRNKSNSLILTDDQLSNINDSKEHKEDMFTVTEYFCILADTHGSVRTALLKLKSREYRSEICFVCRNEYLDVKGFLLTIDGAEEYLASELEKDNVEL